MIQVLGQGQDTNFKLQTTNINIFIALLTRKWIKFCAAKI